MTSLRLLRGLLPLLALLVTPRLRAADTDVLAAVRAADDERVAAILAADPARLDAIFSDGLNYTHSNGHHDTKKSYTDALVSKKTVYKVYHYLDRQFELATPDIAIERAHLIIESENAGKAVTNDLSILAVWRNEGGHWRFLAWQSAKLPAAAPVPAAK
jgi:ketosteroid isomerase-like protein